ncbi:MAG: hypothetical protein K9M56_07135 [Victivallales bacterium]|nr:hypothetical protein [Victivallales bacterium]
MEDNIYSWSYTKHKIFSFCRRKYFYFYFASKNGWKEYSSSLNRKVFVQKHIVPYKKWINNLLISSLRNIFLDTHIIKPEQLENQLKKTLYKSFLREKFNLLNNTHSQEQKLITPLKEIYFYNLPSSNVIYLSEKYLTNLLNTFNSDNKLIKILSEVPRQSKINTFKPSFFYLKKIKIWVSPHLAWFRNGKVTSINLYPETSLNNFNVLDWDLLSSINTLFWQNKFNINRINIETISTFLNIQKNSATNIYCKKNLKETIKFIENSFSTIHSCCSTSLGVYKQNYKKTNDIKKCSTCIFKQFCISEN